MALVPMVVEQTGRGEKKLRYLFKTIKRENNLFNRRDK